MKEANEKIFKIIYLLMTDMVFSGNFDDVRVVHIRESVQKVLKKFGLHTQFEHYIRMLKKLEL